MGLEFHETMRGQVHIEGQQRAFEFTVRARNPSWILSSAPCTLKGTVSLDEVCEGAPLEAGTLDVGLPVRRNLDYRFEFVGHGGQRYRFEGQKQFRWLSPVKSMTTLRGALFSGEERLGDAELHFWLRELPAFLWSFKRVRVPTTS